MWSAQTAYKISMWYAPKTGFVEYVHIYIFSLPRFRKLNELSEQKEDNICQQFGIGTDDDTVLYLLL